MTAYMNLDNWVWALAIEIHLACMQCIQCILCMFEPLQIYLEIFKDLLASWIYLKPNLEYKARILPPQCKYVPTALGQTAIVKLSKGFSLNLILLKFLGKDISSAVLCLGCAMILWWNFEENDAWFQNFCICQPLIMVSCPACLVNNNLHLQCAILITDQS